MGSVGRIGAGQLAVGGIAGCGTDTNTTRGVGEFAVLDVVGLGAGAGVGFGAWGREKSDPCWGLVTLCIEQTWLVLGLMIGFGMENYQTPAGAW